MAMKIFGKSGGGLLTVFKGSSLDDVNSALGKMPQVMEQFSNQLDRADDLLGRLPNKSNQFFTGFTAGIIDKVLPALEGINKTDFTDLGLKIGESLGANISSVMSLIGSGKWWDLLLLEAELAFSKMLQLPVVKQLTELSMFAFGQRSKEDNEWLNGGYTGEIEASIEALHTQIAEKEIARIAALKAQAKPEEKTMFACNNCQAGENDNNNVRWANVPTR